MFHQFKPNDENGKVFGKKSKSCFSKLNPLQPSALILTLTLGTQNICVF